MSRSAQPHFENLVALAARVLRCLGNFRIKKEGQYNWIFFFKILLLICLKVKSTNKTNHVKKTPIINYAHK